MKKYKVPAEDRACLALLALVCLALCWAFLNPSAEIEAAPAPELTEVTEPVKSYTDEELELLCSAELLIVLSGLSNNDAYIVYRSEIVLPKEVVGPAISRSLKVIISVTVVVCSSYCLIDHIPC